MKNQGVPLVHLTNPNASNYHVQCQMLASALNTHGLCRVSFPDTSQSKTLSLLREEFFEIMQTFFLLPEAEKRKSEDESHQGGYTPANTERPSDISEVFANTPQDQLPFEYQQTGSPYDSKQRYMFRSPKEVRVSEQNHNLLGKLIIPDIPGYSKEKVRETINGVHLLMSGICDAATLMIERGLEMWPGTLTKLRENASDLLAPTGILWKHSTPQNTCSAKTHFDLNWLSAHFQSNLPGLFAWINNFTQRLEIKIEPDEVLIQAGMVAELMTAHLPPHKRLYAGPHAVYFSKAARDKMNQLGVDEFMRVSGSFFAEAGLDFMLPTGQTYADHLRGIYQKIGLHS